MSMLEKMFDRYRKEFRDSKEKKNPEQEKVQGTDELLAELLPLAERNTDIFVIVVGLCHYFGNKPFSNGDMVRLVKDPGNAYDPFAIAVFCDGTGKCGYVANSEKTVKEGTLSAKLLCGGIDDCCTAEVLWKDENFVLCKVDGLTSFDLLFNHGVNFCLDGEYESALKIFSALEEKYTKLELLQRICDCYIKLGWNEKALEYVEKALILDEENPRSLLMKKVILENESRV